MAIETTTGNRGTQYLTDGAAHVADVGIPNQKHDRYISGITPTWPGDDSFSVTFTSLDNVRRYRWRFNVTAGTVDTANGEGVRVVEDAVNAAQAGSWLTTAISSSSDDVEYRQHVQENVWTDWVELSKDPNDISLSRLDFLVDAADTTTPATVEIFVEAE